MDKEFIPYEQALSLSELKFNMFCLATIDQTEYIHINGTRQSIRGSMVYNTVYCPLYSQAFKWFREKYGLEIILRPDQLNAEHKKLREYVIVSYDKKWILEPIAEPHNFIRKGCFNTYEEAELDCLKKLIEIVKNK